MEYKGQYQKKDGSHGLIHAEKSFSIASHHPIACGLTAIFFGGYCWFYTVMPTTGQRQAMTNYVQARVDQELGEGTGLELFSNDQKGWSTQEERFELTPRP